MEPEFIFLIVSGLVAGVILLAGLLAMVRARGEDSTTMLPVGPGRQATEKTAPLTPDVPREGIEVAVRALDARVAYRSIIRVFWWLTTAGVLIGVGLAGAYPEARTQIFAIGGLAVLSVLAFHEILPLKRQTGVILMAESWAAFGLGVGLLVLTGYGRSPFAPLLGLTVVAIALKGRRRAAAAGALLATAAYVSVLALDPGRATYVASDLLAFAATLAAIWLLALLAAFYADHERRVQAAALERSVMDPLTELFNRAQLFIDLEQEVRRTRRSDRPFSVLMIDLDGLKVLNDTFGHARGDSVLRGLGHVIRRSIRTVDSAYRYGGDEFVVLLPETEFVGAFVVAEKIRVGAVEFDASLAKDEPLTSVSIGLISHPEDGDGVEQLMLAADRAMYAAKAAGRNQISGAPRPEREFPSAAESAPDGAVRSADADPRVKAVIEALRPPPPPSTSGGVA